jgi:hypothetical protein
LLWPKIQENKQVIYDIETGLNLSIHLFPPLFTEKPQLSFYALNFGGQGLERLPYPFKRKILAPNHVLPSVPFLPSAFANSFEMEKHNFSRS